MMKWGEQNHPDGTGPDLILSELPVHTAAARADHLETWARARCQDAAADGGDTYERILTEEWAEAIASPAGTEKLRTELVQVAAVAVAWVEKLDRERAALTGEPEPGCVGGSCEEEGSCRAHRGGEDAAEPTVEIGGQVMTQAQFDAAQFPLRGSHGRVGEGAAGPKCTCMADEVGGAHHPSCPSREGAAVYQRSNQSTDYPTWRNQ